MVFIIVLLLLGSAHAGLPQDAVDDQPSFSVMQHLKRTVLNMDPSDGVLSVLVGLKGLNNTAVFAQSLNDMVMC